MSEYISKEDISRVLLERIGANKSCLIKAREHRLYESKYYFETLLFEDEQISSLIEELTSADVRPNIHGHWIRVTDKAGHLVWECDKCGWQKRLWTNYCPECGAIMDGESKVTAKVEIDGEPISKTIADMREPKCETCKNCNKAIGCSKHIACQRENMKFYEPIGEKGTE